MAYPRLVVHFVRREISLRYGQSLIGALWPFLIPLALLAIYSFVFVIIFRARVPEAEVAGFVPYLALGFWPWMAFAESVSRGTSVISENESLIRKSPIPHDLLVYSSVISNFGLQVVGYVAVFIVLALVGTPFHWFFLPLITPFILLAFVFALAITFVFATLQVFIKDVSHAMGAILTLWFFSTPVLYSPTLIPEVARPYLMLNPMAYYITRIRDILIQGQWQPLWSDAVAVLGTFGLFALSLWFFRRCSQRFEDFL